MNRLKELRTGKKLSIQSLAKNLNVSDEIILEYENEDGYIEHDILRKISDFYNVSYNYILGLSEEKDTSDIKILSQYKIDSFYKTNPSYELKLLFFIFNKLIKSESYKATFSIDEFKVIFNSPYEYLYSSIRYSLRILHNKTLKIFTKRNDRYILSATDTITSYFYSDKVFDIEISQALFNYLKAENSVTFLLNYHNLFENSIKVISYLIENNETITFDELKPLFNYQEEPLLKTSNEEMDTLDDFDLLYRFFNLLKYKMIVAKKVDSGILLTRFLDDFTFNYDKKSFEIGKFNIDINNPILILSENDFRNLK
ncbi:TPA: helix-turn-helix transcriptional regulator [Clostridioides difficile]|nr:helix-turn-helix transcriptional regulator [Clostridioides difficile]